MDQATNTGELGLAGILVWMRFMATRQLIWNKNYNVKPRYKYIWLQIMSDKLFCYHAWWSLTNLFFIFILCSEISKAQDRLTDLLQSIYTTHPQHRELLRMIMSTVGRGGEGDVGQRIRDEILVIQVKFEELVTFFSAFILNLFCIYLNLYLSVSEKQWVQGRNDGRMAPEVT